MPEQIRIQVPAIRGQQVPIVQAQGQRYICPKCGSVAQNDKPDHPLSLELQNVIASGQVESWFGCLNCYMATLRFLVPALVAISDQQLADLNAQKNPTSGHVIATKRVM